MQTSNLNATAIEFVPSLQPLNDPSDIDSKSPFKKGNGKYQNDLIPSIKKESPPQYSPIKSNLYASYASIKTVQDNNPIIYAQDLVHYNYYSSDDGSNQMEMIPGPSNVQYGVESDIYSQYQHVPHPIYSHHDQYVHSYPTQQQQLFPVIEQLHHPIQQQQQLVSFQHQHVHSQVPVNENFISPQSVKSISYESITTTTTTDHNNPIIYAQDIVNYNYYTSPSNVQYGGGDKYYQYQHVHLYPTQQQQQFPMIEQPYYPLQQQQQYVYYQEPINDAL